MVLHPPKPLQTELIRATEALTPGLTSPVKYFVEQIVLLVGHIMLPDVAGAHVLMSMVTYMLFDSRH